MEDRVQEAPVATLRSEIDRYVDLQRLCTADRTRAIRRRELYAFERWYKGTLEDLSVLDICGYLDSMRAGRLESSVKVIAGILRSFYRWLRPGSTDQFPRVTASSEVSYPFTEEQLQEIIQVARGPRYRREWPVMCLIAWHTGLRFSDIALLQWESVDLGAGMLTVKPIKRRRANQRLEIPIADDLRAAFDEAESFRRPGNPYVLPDMADQYRDEIQRIQLLRQFRVILDQLELRKHSFHSFRHAFVSRLLNSGVDSQIVGSLTGQTVSTIQKYAHISPAAKRRALTITQAEI